MLNDLDKNPNDNNLLIAKEKKMKNKVLLNSQQVRKKLNISQTTLWRWNKKKEGVSDFPKSIPLGGKLMWYEDEIDTWVDSKRSVN